MKCETWSVRYDLYIGIAWMKLLISQKWNDKDIEQHADRCKSCQVH